MQAIFQIGVLFYLIVFYFASLHWFPCNKQSTHRLANIMNHSLLIAGHQSRPRAMGCLGECLDLGPPPDSILFMPPPPVPDFLQHSLPELLLNTTPCWAAQICEPSPISNKVPDILEDYVELPRKGNHKYYGLVSHKY